LENHLNAVGRAIHATIAAITMLIHPLIQNPFQRPLLLGMTALFLTSCRPVAEPEVKVGPTPHGMIVATRQLIRPAGKSVEFRGRPNDLVVAPDGKTVYAKSSEGIIVIDSASWQILAQVKYAGKFPGKSGSSPHGIVMNRQGSRLYVTVAQSKLLEASVDGDGKLEFIRSIELPAPAGDKRQTFPCGVALSPDQRTAVVCLDGVNLLAVVDLETGRVRSQIPVGVAPYAVCLSPDGKTAYVSNWGGRRPQASDNTAKSDGSDVIIDNHSTASSGMVSVVDLVGLKETTQVEVGLHPSDLVLSKDGRTLYVANANSDTVSVIDTVSGLVRRTVQVRPDAALPFGSAANALALSKDETMLFVALGGNNAVAVVPLENGKAELSVSEFIPTAWYPGALAVHGGHLFVANVKGLGSRDPKAAGKWNTHSAWGSVTNVAISDAAVLKQYTQQVKQDALVPQALKAWEKGQKGTKPLPVPRRFGEPSVFDHVVYIIKENRTYDQLLGDIGKGNSDPKLCIFGRDVTPNQHALALQFALLDNFYCNGVLSADGHAWATEGLAVDYLEKSFGAWVRSYPFGGDDPMAISPTGFIWDDVLLHGLSFRNYGEMVLSQAPRSVPVTTTAPIDLSKYSHQLGPKALETYTNPVYPGWNLHIPDALRAQVFLSEFEQFKQKNQFPNLTTIYLPDDHTHGTAPGERTPNAMVANNDLVVGRIVDAISHSAFWPTTCIFVTEDDPQSGFDHVDGHRSICLVISPYTKRAQVISTFYNQTSVLHTMELMLGIPPMNQMDAMAPAMTACFNPKPDLSPYLCVPNNVPLDQRNPPKTALRGKTLELAEKSSAQNWDEPDRADDNTLNRVLWNATRGPQQPYPASFAGAHGRGLKALHLTLEQNVKDDN
jgi:YVTN family beta-propeller protein